MLNVLQNHLKCRSKLLFFKSSTNSSFCFCYLNPNLLCCIYHTDKYIKPEILRGKRRVWRECDIVDCIPISCSPWQMLEMYWIYQALCWTMGGIFPRRHCWPQTWLKARQLWTCQRADYLPGGEKAGLQKGRQPSVFTEITRDKSNCIFLSYNQSFRLPRILEKAGNSFPLCGRSTEGGKPAGSLICCLQYEPGSSTTAVISIPGTGASHWGWIIPLA